MPKLSKSVLFVAVLLALLQIVTASTSFAADGAIQVTSNVPYSASSHVDTKIVQECSQLGPKLGSQKGGGR